jgi:predicted outer membrane repeat protein
MKFVLGFLLVRVQLMLAQDYYVKPDNSTSICPGVPCLTLGQVTDRYFTTGSTFLFLSGNHSLQTELRLTGINDITLKGLTLGNGSFAATIILGKRAAIVCHNASNFRIEGLTFILCKYRCEKESFLRFLSSDRVTISNSTFGNETLANVKSVYSQNSNTTVLNCVFKGNSDSDGSGGAMEISGGSTSAIIGTTFTGNRGRFGGAIYSSNSMLYLSGNIFEENRSSSSAGALYCSGGTLALIGNNYFTRNSVAYSVHGYSLDKVGGAIHINSMGRLVFSAGNSFFSENEAFGGGGIVTVDSTMVCEGGARVHFRGNRATYGGGIHMVKTQVDTRFCELSFTSNIAVESGGAMAIGYSYRRYIPIDDKHVVYVTGSFVENRAQNGGAMFINNENVVLKQVNITGNSGSALCIYDSTVRVEYYSSTVFTNNTGEFGGAIYSSNSILRFTGRNYFDSNSAVSGGAVYLLYGSADFQGGATFIRNSAERYGGALYVVRTAINIEGTGDFTLNFAGKDGGAVYIKSDGSLLTMKVQTKLNFSFNAALGNGGGLLHVDNTDHNQCSYNKDSKHRELPLCFIQFKPTLMYAFMYAITQGLSISSYNDSAGKDGNFMYGGLLDRCTMYRQDDLNQQNITTVYQFITDYDILHVTLKDNRTHGITSEPYTLCLCNAGAKNCTGSLSLLVHRGQKFTVPLVALAQGNSTSSTLVTALTSPTASFKQLQNPQNLPSSCSNLTYNLFSTEESEVVTLYPEGPCHDTGNAGVVLNFTLLPCPDGFVPAPDGRCTCEGRLREYNVSCTIDEDIQLTRSAGSQFWMGIEYANGSYQGLILYKTCPVGYCRRDEVIMTLHDLDVQCVQGRRGVLCGGCAENHSILMGSSTCRECSNSYLTLIIPFGVAGIALVAFLSVLRLTVATGMINSLIIYANIVQVNRRLFFPANTVNILTVFIAWLNLDLGFQTCFYHKMDAFAQTFLQFVFPVYVWALISLIILTSRYSITMSRLIGHNPIAVLATLLLMSYAKVLNIIIEVYSSVDLDRPVGHPPMSVWLKDANIPYLQSKHLVLTVVTSLVLIFLFLPYTLLLLLGHQVYRYSGKKYLRWFNNIKPLLDAYYAPYKIHTRFWTGFLLLIRCALYVVFSFNSLGATQDSLLAVIITFTAVGFAMGFIGIYKSLGVNILEASTYLNLVVLSSITLAEVSHEIELSYSLVGIMFVTTLGIIVYHFHLLYTAKSVMWLKFIATVSQCRDHKSTKTPQPMSNTTTTSSHDPHKIVSKTVVELREPLLENTIEVSH